MLLCGKGFDVKNSSRNPSPNTVAFSCLEPQVATLILDVIAALVSVLRWRQVSQSLLIAILSRLAELPFFELTHAEFSAALWPHLADSAREKKFSKWLAKFKEDIALSNCAPVRIGKPRVERRSDGSFKSLPTMYTSGIFWLLFRAVQDAAMECDLMREENVNKRRAKVRAIVAAWLKESGAVPIERAKKDEQIKPAKPSLPCNCLCPSCVCCFTKNNATASEANGAEPVLSVQIEREKRRLVEIEREFVAIGTAMINRGIRLSIVDNKLNAVGVSARVQLKTAAARKAGRGNDYAPDTEARAHGRAALEVAIDALKDAQAQAEIIGKGKHGAKFEELWKALQQWRVFENRAGVSFEGGQPK